MDHGARSILESYAYEMSKHTVIFYNFDVPNKFNVGFLFHSLATNRNELKL